jgi:hypothetical protein
VESAFLTRHWTPIWQATNVVVFRLPVCFENVLVKATECIKPTRHFVDRAGVGFRITVDGAQVLDFIPSGK